MFCCFICFLLLFLFLFLINLSPEVGIGEKERKGDQQIDSLLSDGGSKNFFVYMSISSNIMICLLVSLLQNIHTHTCTHSMRKTDSQTSIPDHRRTGCLLRRIPVAGQSCVNSRLSSRLSLSLMFHACPPPPSSLLLSALWSQSRCRRHFFISSWKSYNHHREAREIPPPPQPACADVSRNVQNVSHCINTKWS